MNEPLVSVVIPTFNREKTIIAAVQSVLNQTYRNIELIVVDDGSTDGTKKLLMEINDPRFRYIYQKNTGACRARNNGIDNSKGEYIAFHDSDDIWLPNKLNIQMKAMLKHNPDLVTCRLDRLQFGITPTIKSGFINDKPLTQISTQTLLVKREVCDKIKFDERLKRYQDLDFVINVCVNNFKLYMCDEALVTWSYNDDSITAKNINKTDALDIIIDKYKGDIKLLSKTFYGILCDRALVNYRNNNKKDAIVDFIEAFKISRDLRPLIRVVLIKMGISF